MTPGLKKYPVSSDKIESVSCLLKGKPCLSNSAVIGNVVFLSGLSRIKKEKEKNNQGIRNQTAGCLDSVKAALEQAGSSLDNLVKLVILIKDSKSSPEMWGAIRRYFREYAPLLIKEPPAVTVIPVGGFLEPDCQVQIDSIAVLSKNGQGWKVKKYSSRHQSTRNHLSDLDSKARLSSDVVMVGNLLFFSGFSGENPHTGTVETPDFESQMDAGFERIREAFDLAGSSPCNIIKTLHMLTGLEDMLISSKDRNVSHSPASDRLWKRELEHYEMYAPELLEDFPASTFLKLPALETPGAKVEIDVTGVVSLDEPGWEVKKYPLYYGKRGFPRHIGEIKKYYSNTVVVGDIIFISGQTPTDQFTGRIETDTFEEQVNVALYNLRLALEETGSSLSHLVKTYILMPDNDHYPIFRTLEREYYKKYAPGLIKDPPASTFIQPLNLASPKMMIEIDAIGYLPKR